MEKASEKTSGKSVWKKVWRVLFLVGSLALLYWLLSTVGWAKINEYAVQLGWLGVAVLVVMGVAETLADGISLKLALREEISLFYLHAANQTGGLVNRIIPWEAGEVLKVTLFRQRVSAKAAISGIIVWNYVHKLTKPIAVLVAIAAAFVFAPSPLPKFTKWVVLAAAVSFAPYAVFRLLVHIGIAKSVVRLLKLVRLVRRDTDELIAKAKEIDAAVREFSKEDPLAYYQTLIFQLLGRFLSWATMFAALYFIGHPFDFATTGLVWAGFIVMGYLVGILPSRLGTTEASGWLLFKLFEYDPALGLLLSCIMTLKAIIASGLAALTIHCFRSPAKPE